MDKYKAENSHNTSINKLAATYKKFKGLLQESRIVLDYGAGKYICNIKEFCSENNINIELYDPFNSAIDHVNFTKKYDTVICNNVLNVIYSDNDLREVIKNCIGLAEKVVIFKIYQGDKTGISDFTKRNTFQRNWLTEDYMFFLNKLIKSPLLPEYKDFEIEVKGDYIIIFK